MGTVISKKAGNLVIVLAALAATAAVARDTVIRISPARDPSQYGQDELRRRVWELERAVDQLQRRVYQLEASPSPPLEERWTCRLEAFGKLYAATRGSRGEAMTQVMQECAGRHGAMFCSEDKARCGQ